MRITYSVFLSYSHPTQLDLSPSLPTQLCGFFFLTHVWLVLPVYWMCSLPLKHGRLISSHNLKKIDSVSPSNYQWPITPQLGAGWLCAYFLLSILQFGWAWDHTRCVHVIIAPVNSLGSAVSEDTGPLKSSIAWALTLFPPPSPQWFLSLGKRGYDADVLFRAKHSSFSYSVHLGQLLISVLIAVDCNYKLLW